MKKYQYSPLVIVAAICIAMTPFSGLKLAGRGISLYLYALFAVCAVHQIFRNKGKLYFNKIQCLFIVLLLFSVISYSWTPVDGRNPVVEGDHSTIVKGAFFVLVLMLFNYTSKGKELFQLFALLGSVGMAAYMIFSSEGTYSYQFSNRVTFAIGDSITEANNLSFLLIIPVGYAITRLFNPASYGKGMKVMLVISIFLLLYILLFTGSRAGILAIIATVFFGTILSLFNFKKIKKRALVTLVILFPLSFFVIQSIIEQLPTSILSRLSLQNFLLATSGANGRLDIWERAINTLNSEGNVLHLMFGHGFLSSEIVFGVTLHNLFLQVLYEEGVIGLIIILMLFYRIIKDAITEYKVDVLCESIGLLVLSMSLAGVNSRFFWICFSILIICSRPDRTSEENDYA